MYEATVEKTFCASHALKMPGGGSEPMHGHNWKVEVTIAARGLDAMDTVMDLKIAHFFERKLPEDVWVFSVTVHEAPGCKATYRPS